MRFKYIWQLLLLISGSLAAIYLLLDNNTELATSNTTTAKPIIYSSNVINSSFTKDGKLNYRLAAEQIEFAIETNQTTFTAPILTVFHNGIKKEWLVTANKAILSKSRYIKLSGNVTLRNLNQSLLFNNITTETLDLDLESKDFSTLKPIVLSGENILSSGTGLKGNLKKKAVKILEKVKTKYAISKD